MDDYLEAWERFLSARYSATTVKAYLHDARRFEDKQGSLLDAETNDIVEYITAEGNRLAASTVSRSLSALRCFFSFAVLTELLPESPMEGIKAGTVRRPLPRVLTEAQADALILAPHSLRDRVVILLMLYAGLRVSEVSALRRDSIDLAGSIRIKGKGDKERIVPLHPDLSACLREWLESTGRFESTAPLFHGYRNQPLSRRAIEDLVARTGKRAGLARKLTPHMLRHTFATRLMKRGANLRQVQELLGHSSVATTQIYTHVTSAELTEAVGRL